MENKDKNKKGITIVLRILGALCAGVLCVPVTRYFNELLGSGETNFSTMSSAVVCCGLVLVIVLAVLCGLGAVTGKDVRFLVAGIGIIAAVCITAGVFSMKNMPVRELMSDASPRPTVTPPTVVIEEKEEYQNPESGTVFYRKYYDNNVKLTVDNGSSSDLYIKLREKKAGAVLIFYVRGGDTVTVNAPVGSYEYVCAAGKQWIDEENLFGENTKIKKSREICVLKWAGSHEISLGRNLSELLEVSRNEFDK